MDFCVVNICLKNNEIHGLLGEQGQGIESRVEEGDDGLSRKRDA